MLINFALAKALKYMWNMMNVLQFVVFMTMWQVRIPSGTTVVLRNIKMLVLLEFIPKQEIKNFIYRIVGLRTDDIETNVNEDIVENSGIERTGSPDLIQNMGMFLLVAIATAITVIVMVIVFCIFRKHPKVVALFQKIIGAVFFNAIIRYFL